MFALLPWIVLGLFLTVKAVSDYGFSRYLAFPNPIHAVIVADRAIADWRARRRRRPVIGAAIHGPLMVGGTEIAEHRRAPPMRTSLRGS